MTIEEELLNKEYWEQTFERMVLKQGFSKENKEIIWKLKEIYREDIVKEIMNGTYEWSTPRKVLIAKSGSKKKRTVYVYNTEDRYILGVLYRAISSYYSNKISDLCYSYKKRTSTSTAIEHIKSNRNEQFKYGVKIDIHAYFNSVSREKVLSMIKELFSDGIKTTVEKLLLNDTVLWQDSEIQEWKSLIPGCAFGSFLANYCLRECDYEFEQMDLVYARYSDDIIILDKTKELLQYDLGIINKYLNKYGLTINPDKYTWFEPGDSVEYLGLKITDTNSVDISDHAKRKIKKQIHRWCRKGRIEIENNGKSFESVARRIIRQLNHKNFKCYIKGQGTFGWCHYAYSKITVVESLKEIDFYTIDTLRAMKTGKHNKANVKALSHDEAIALGWISLVDLYNLYKKDFDYYCEIIELC